MKRTPEEWCQIKGIVIIDPDGWRTMTLEQRNETGALDGLENWNVPIDEADFDRRAALSTASRYQTYTFVLAPTFQRHEDVCLQRGENPKDTRFVLFLESVKRQPSKGRNWRQGDAVRFVGTVDPDLASEFMAILLSLGCPREVVAAALVNPC